MVIMDVECVGEEAEVLDGRCWRFGCWADGTVIGVRHCGHRRARRKNRPCRRPVTLENYLLVYRDLNLSSAAKQALFKSLKL